jgi:CIC family chloride channel protein
VVVLDDEDRYVGIVQVAEVYADADDEHVVGDLLHHADTVLLPKMTIKEAVAMFENAESDALAVVDGPETRHVIGLLTERMRCGGIVRNWTGDGGSCPASRRMAPCA